MDKEWWSRATDKSILQGQKVIRLMQEDKVENRARN